jgi:hypothetical protein
MNDSFVGRILAESLKANQISLDLRHRTLSMVFATVVDNRDPLGLRRVKCSTESKAGLTTTDWLLQLVPWPYHDPPLPAIGTSVIIGFIDGDPHDGFFVSVCISDVNPADTEQQNPVEDNTLYIPGDNKETIGGDSTELIEGNHKHTIKQDETRLTEGKLDSTVKGNETRQTDLTLSVSAGQSITLTTASGASLTLTAAGVATLSDAFGNKMTVGGASGGGGYASDLEWECQGDLNLTVSGKLLVNGNEVCVTGAMDTMGDQIIESGQ